MSAARGIGVSVEIDHDYRNYEVSAPPGVMLPGTSSHSRVIDWPADYPADLTVIYSEMLDVIREGVVPCEIEECDTCEEGR